MPYNRKSLLNLLPPWMPGKSGAVGKCCVVEELTPTLASAILGNPNTSREAAMTCAELARMIDLTAVRPDTDERAVRDLASIATRLRCCAVFTLPIFTPLLFELLAAERDIAVGGTVGFPSGAATTATKVAETREFIAWGCPEIDMVMSFGLLRSQRDAEVLDEMRQVKDAAVGRVLKIILECHYLSDEQILRASEYCVRAGADFVKTSTGWAPTGATARNVTLIKSVVGDRVAIKAAGGIRSLADIKRLLRLGVSRFGVGYRSAESIFEECAQGG